MSNLVRIPLSASLFLGPLLVTGLSLAGQTSITGGIGSEYVTWREYASDTHQQLLQESGLRAFAELGLSTAMSMHSDFRARGRIYAGNLYYDGQYQDGTPATTTTEYRGLAGEMGVAYLPSARPEDKGLALIMNLGADRWNRSIAGSGGYEEQYRMIFVRMGVDQEAEKGSWSARGGVLLPLNTQEEVKLYDGITLEPEGKPSLYFGLGYRFQTGMECRFDYQAYRFDASRISSRPVTSGGVPVDLNGDGVPNDRVYQPRSDLDSLGVSLHWRF